MQGLVFLGLRFCLVYHLSFSSIHEVIFLLKAINQFELLSGSFPEILMSKKILNFAFAASVYHEAHRSGN
jgi:hypothetical protein